jgi:hypothetical protein
MTRAALEHIIRAAGSIADVEELIVVGSQAILGEFPDAPPELLLSNEADVFPRSFPERADLIDSTIGEGSPFERAFGYYARSVGPETAILPEGWQKRLVLVRCLVGSPSRHTARPAAADPRSTENHPPVQRTWIDW